MVEEKNTQTLDACEKFAFASVAKRFVQQGRYDLANTALDKIKFDDDMNIFIKNSEYFTSQQGIQEASAIFDGEFNNLLLEQKVSGIVNFYSKPIDELSKENKRKINNIYSSLAGKTLGDVMGSYQEAGTVLKFSEQHKDKFSKEDVKSAQEVVDKYKTFMETHGLLMENKFNGLSYQVQEKHTKNLLEQIAGELPGIKEKKTEDNK